MTRYGQHPEPLHTIAHFSDPHFLESNRPLYDAVDTEANLLEALALLERSGTNPEAIVFTGDLADLGESEAYIRLRATVEPVAERMGTRIIWVMGNHDERAIYQRLLFDEDGTDAPQDRVYDVGGLRIIAVDSTVPGYHHGAITDDQLDWLADQLGTPAEHGTLLALHHPPIPTPLDIMALLELEQQHRLADVVRGTDVRGILGGHLHYSTHSTFAGIPVSVASATCYTLDLSAPPRTLSGVGGSQAFNLVHVYDDRIVHSIVPVAHHAEVSGFSADMIAQLDEMSHEERLERFSRKRP